MGRLKIGSDPELSLLSVASSKEKNKAELFPANSILPSSGELGCDGHSVIAEFRPPASTEVDEHVKSIKRLLGQLYETIDSTGTKLRSVSAGSGIVDPTGGHIHFGTTPDATMLRALDYFLSMPLLMVEQEPYNTIRRKDRYGLLGAWEEKPYGFEYRAPASWLVSEDVARGALSMAKWIVGSLDSGNADRELISAAVKKIDKEIAYDSVSLFYKKSMKRSSDEEAGSVSWFLDEYFYPLIATAKTFPKKESERLLEMIKSGETWDEWVDLSINWGLNRIPDTTSGLLFTFKDSSLGYFKSLNISVSTVKPFKNVSVFCTRATYLVDAPKSFEKYSDLFEDYAEAIGLSKEFVKYHAEDDNNLILSPKAVESSMGKLATAGFLRKFRSRFKADLLSAEAEALAKRRPSRKLGRRVDQAGEGYYSA